MAGSIMACGNRSDARINNVALPSDGDASRPSDASVTDASSCYVPQVGCNGCNPQALAGIWTPQQVQNCKVTFDIEVNSFDAAGGKIDLYVDVDCVWRDFGNNEDGGLSWEPGPVIQVPSLYDTFLEVMPVTVTLPSEACDLVNANSNSHVYVFAGACGIAIMCGDTM